MTGSAGSKVERRRVERRTKAERRQDVRWEPTKINRRSGKGRRAADKVSDKNAWR